MAITSHNGESSDSTVRSNNTPVPASSSSSPSVGTPKKKKKIKKNNFEITEKRNQTPLSRKPIPFAQIFGMIAGGHSLKKACVKLGVQQPLVNAAFLKSPNLAMEYARARAEQAEYYADEIVEITDTEKDANRARVKVDARKWIASKLLPKKYGDIPSAVNVGIQNNVSISMSEKDQREYQERLAKLRET